MVEIRMIGDIIYGGALRQAWPFDPAVTYLNHGGYGATPKTVLAEQQAWRDRIERNPTGFLSRELPAALRDAAAAVAARLGARGEDLVFVENATSGINAVLRSLDLAPGDDVVIAGLAYPAILKAARFVAAARGARLVEVALPLPVRDAAQLRAAVAARLGPRTRLVIADHIASASALVWPVAELVADAHAAGARILIDGAHAPGQIALDIAALGADWYVGNLHKWYFAPRACGFLWAAPAARRDLHPLSISHGLGQGFCEEFDWTGTRDFTSALTAPEAIAFHQKLGGAQLMARNAALVRDGAAHLARIWRTGLAGPPELFAAMATVRLPASGDTSPERARALARWLGEAHRIETIVTAESGALWLRVAAQAYNTPAEYERLGAVVAGSNLP
jgi:isopenicillin-N epimerase